MIDPAPSLHSTQINFTLDEINEMSYYSFTAQIKGVEVHKLWHYVREKLHGPDDFLGKEFEVTIAFYMNKIATLFACQGADLNI